MKRRKIPPWGDEHTLPPCLCAVFRFLYYDPPPCAPTNGRPGFPFGFLGAGGRLPKARLEHVRGRFFFAQYCCYFRFLYGPFYYSRTRVRAARATTSPVERLSSRKYPSAGVAAQKHAPPERHGHRPRPGLLWNSPATRPERLRHGGGRGSPLRGRAKRYRK